MRSSLYICAVLPYNLGFQNFQYVNVIYLITLNKGIILKSTVRFGYNKIGNNEQNFQSKMKRSNFLRSTSIFDRHF